MSTASTVAPATVDHDVEPPDAAEGRAARRGPTLGFLTGAAFTVFGLIVGVQPLHDNSFLTHLATGRIILRSGGIPRSDPYSFTAHGSPWVVQSWLASVAYAGAEKLGGLAGIRLLEGVLVAVAATLVWRLTAAAVGLIPRVAIAGVACGVGIGLWVERPLMFGVIAFAALIVLVEGKGDLRWLVPTMWIWVNTHGSFPLGIGLLLLLAIGTRLDGARPTRELQALGWAVAGTLLGAVNPLGPRLLTFPVTLLQKSQSFSTVQEWKPPTWDSPSQLLFALQLVLAAVLLLRSRRWRAVLPFVVFAGLALTAARNIVPASLVLVPGMALGASGLGQIDGQARPRIGRAAIVVLAALGLLLTVSALQGPDTNLAPYPEQATTWIQDHQLLDQRVIAPDYAGNYLEARYGPGRRVFVDDRVDMYPESVVRDAKTLREATPGWPTVLQRHRAGVVLWPADQPLTSALRASPRWRVAYQDPRWVIFLPSDHAS